MLDERSRAKLETCSPALQEVFYDVIQNGKFRFKIIEGHRPPERQQELYDLGRSKVKHGKHNETPSKAVDVVPLQADGSIDWNDRELFTLFAGYILGVADQLDINIRWGGDWDSDKDLKDNRFDDLVHFEEV